MCHYDEAMSRLADYFVIVGVKDPSTLEHGKEFKGTVIQKFPVIDRKDVPFPQAVELFCQPSGWSISQKSLPSTFYVAILTDIEGNHSYCACLSFHEPVQLGVKANHGHGRSSQVLNSSNESPGSDHAENTWDDESVVYIPKCLCLVSRQRYFATLKNCLATIYVAFLNNNTPLLASLTGSILGFVHVPPPGGPKLTFSIGAGDTQIIQPPLSKDLPVTDQSVAILFNFLGIHNMLLLFSALVTENKILIVSSSYSHLTLAAEALVSLLYPMTFSYVFIPVLPVSLLDFLTAPTPFLMGVHMSYESQIPELCDVVIVNVDQGFVVVPDNVHLPEMPEPFYARTLRLLKMILTPSLLSADLLFAGDSSAPSLAYQDKELRAVFVHLFADMFSGYRSCLTLIRIHPKPVISFNKIAFLEKRCFIGDEFFNKLLDSVSFSQMIASRGPPFRPCNLFDELIASVDCSKITRDVSDEKLLAAVQCVARKLNNNEPDFESSNSSQTTTITSPETVNLSQQFPMLNGTEVEKFISENSEQDCGSSFKPKPPVSQRVPVGVSNHPLTHFINKRRLEVIKDAVAFIFDNKISEARKVLPSVLRALKSKGAQLSLCNELAIKIRQNKAMLETDQFQLVVRLMNAILQDDSTLSNTSVAAALVPLSCAFFRKLTAGVFQFAYSCIQDHPIWASLQFWEEAFYAEAQTQIMEFHILEREKKERKRTASSNNVVKIDVSKTLSDPDPPLKRIAMENANKGAVRNSVLLVPTPPMKARSRTNTLDAHDDAEAQMDDERQPLDALNAMDLAAELLSDFPDLNEEEQKRLVSEEESIVYSLATLYASRMIYLRVPLAACAEMRRFEEKRQKMQERRAQLQRAEGQSDSCLDIQDNVSRKNDPSQVTAVESTSTIVGGSVRDGSNSVAGSVMWSSMHDLTDLLDFGSTIADQTAKFIVRFVERICIEANVTTEHIKSLQHLIPSLVNMHIESLDELYRETKFHAPIKKAKINKPAFLHGEVSHFDGLRCYLIPDGREFGVKTESSSAMLPAKDIESDHEIDMGADLGGPCLLPAEGAVFLTNYRVVFKGSPVDQFASEMTVTRSFPVSALVKEKKLSGRFWIGPDTYVEECIQLRTSTFQLLRLCFDQEVPLEQVENFRKHLQKLRWPASIHTTFAFANQHANVTVHRTLSQRQQNVRRSNRTFTNVAVMARKKVAQTRGSLRKHKYAVADDTTKKRYQSVNSYEDGGAANAGDASDTVSISEDDIRMTFAQTNLGADKLSESFICRDYERVGLGSINKKQTLAAWRLSMVNGNYGVCRSYPTVVIVPSKVTDETVMKVAKNHRLNRFPVAVWKHKKTRAVLLRSGGVSKGVMTAVLKAGLGGVGSQGILSSTVSEDERFLTEIVNATSISSHLKKAQSVSIGAALSLSNVFEDFSSMAETSNRFSKVVDDVVQEKSWTASNLYIFSEKALAKGTKFEATSKCNFVTIEMHDVSQVKMSFSKLLKACCPSVSKADTKFLKDLEDAKWLQQLSSVLQVSVAAVNLMEIQGSSCMISFGDGSDVTTQIVSLIQLMMDPFYRTFEGLRVLIEKDWLAFGHRFAHRGNHLSTMQNGVAPFFLQFLDAVHQVILQYPSSFEYNDAFLRFLAYHHVSMRFNNFLLDSEHERHQYGWLTPYDETDPTMRKLRGFCMWRYIEEHMGRLTMFHNFRYHPSLNKGVLQPFCNVSSLVIWEYYTAENLFTGPVFDLELLSEIDVMSSAATPSHVPPGDVDGKEDIGYCLTGCYGDTSQFSRDECSYLLNEIYRLKEELDQNPRMWKDTWDLLDIRQNLKESRNTVQWHRLWIKERAVSLQKRETMEIVLQGKTSETSNRAQATLGFEQPHNFQFHNYIVHTTCDYCLQSIWGFGRVGLQCANCGYHVHEKCQSMVPAKCPKHSNLEEQQVSGLSTSTHSVPGSEHSMKMTSNPRGFKSQLYKRGNLLRQWKARWFVLDAQRNQMRYYENEDDSHLQGFIDLADMRSCSLSPHAPPGAPKWALSGAFFEIAMTKRVYHLLANDKDTAHEWVERLTDLIG